MKPPKNQNESLSNNQAKAILQFLQRTQMQGAEMPVYVDVFNTLSAIAGADAEDNNMLTDSGAIGTV